MVQAAATHVHEHYYSNPVCGTVVLTGPVEVAFDGFVVFLFSLISSSLTIAETAEINRNVLLKQKTPIT